MNTLDCPPGPPDGADVQAGNGGQNLAQGSGAAVVDRLAVDDRHAGGNIRHRRRGSCRGYDGVGDCH